MARLSQARLLPPQGPGDGGGSVLLPGLLPLGTPLGPPPSDHLQPSVAACCAACRAVPECTAFGYCNREVRPVAAWEDLWVPEQPATGNCLACKPACADSCRIWPPSWRQGGCTEGTQNLTAPHRACQLVHQNETAPGTGRPVLLVPAPQFVGGAPWHPLCSVLMARPFAGRLVSVASGSGDHGIISGAVRINDGCPVMLFPS